jgi:hypothetical protein
VDGDPRSDDELECAEMDVSHKQDANNSNTYGNNNGAYGNNTYEPVQKERDATDFTRGDSQSKKSM